MALLNLLLDLAALVLALSALGVGSPAPAHRAGTLLGNLKPAETRRPRRWPPLVGLAGLLLLRPIFYAPLAEATGWVPTWNPTPASLPFRADFSGRLLSFSLISFGWTAILFLTWMLLLAALARGTREPGAWNRFFGDLLGSLARLPVILMILLPALVGGLVWLAAVWPLQWIGVLPSVHTGAFLAWQAMLVGAGVWVSARWLLAGLLILRLINTYVYLGTHPFWDFVQQIGGVLLRPLGWLPARFGKFDLTALVAAAIIFAAGWAAERGLAELYLQLRP